MSANDPWKTCICYNLLYIRILDIIYKVKKNCLLDLHFFRSGKKKMQSDMLYLFCKQLVWWAIILVPGIQLCQLLFWYIYIYLFPSQFLKVTEIYKCIYTKQNLIFRDLVQFQVCRWFHAPSNTDCISYELNKIFYFQRSAAWPHFLPMICVYQYLCISKSFAVHMQVHSLLFCVLFSLLSRMKRSLNRYMYCFCWKMFCVPWTQISKVYCIEKFSVHDSCINKAKNITK